MSRFLKQKLFGRYAPKFNPKGYMKSRPNEPLGVLQSRDLVRELNRDFSRKIIPKNEKPGDTHYRKYQEFNDVPKYIWDRLAKKWLIPFGSKEFRFFADTALANMHGNLLKAKFKVEGDPLNPIDTLIRDKYEQSSGRELPSIVPEKNMRQRFGKLASKILGETKIPRSPKKHKGRKINAIRRWENLAKKVSNELKRKWPEYRIGKRTGVRQANKMADLARVSTNDVVLDPFGGTGFSSMIVSYRKPKVLMAADLLYTDKTQPTPKDMEKIWDRRSKDPEFRTPITTIATDSNRLPIAGSSVDKIITSPPYFLDQKQKSMLGGFLKEFYPEMRRVMKHDGLLVMRVPQNWDLTELRNHGFILVETVKFKEQVALYLFRLNK